jgi:Acetyltransferases
MLTIRKYQTTDVEAMRQIWNQIVEEGLAFPQEEFLTTDAAVSFFAEQTYTAVADYDGQIVGLYILHPNNVGRCSHIANTSYAVAAQQRGKKIGEQLVKDSICQAKNHDFQLLQFNAVVATNTTAIRLYNKLGFTQLAAIPNGFRLKDGSFTDIYPFYLELNQ